LVEFISSREEALGVVVPIPTEPVEGNVLVCANNKVVLPTMNAANKTNFVFINFDFIVDAIIFLKE
jgi:hypothetical protein